MSKNKRPSGGATLRAAGKTAIQIGATADQIKILRDAASSAGIPVTQFLMYHGLAAAKKILHNSA